MVRPGFSSNPRVISASREIRLKKPDSTQLTQQTLKDYNKNQIPIKDSTLQTQGSRRIGLKSRYSKNKDHSLKSREATQSKHSKVNLSSANIKESVFKSHKFKKKFD